MRRYRNPSLTLESLERKIYPSGLTMIAVVAEVSTATGGSAQSTPEVASSVFSDTDLGDDSSLTDPGTDTVDPPSPDPTEGDPTTGGSIPAPSPGGDQIPGGSGSPSTGPTLPI